METPAYVLEFEKPLRELTKQLDELRQQSIETHVDLAKEIRGIEGKIIAVGLYRRVRSVEEAEKDRWAHRRDGKVVWIDQLAAPGCVLGHMLWHFLSREALEEPFTHFAGHRMTRNQRITCLPASTVERILLPR